MRKFDHSAKKTSKACGIEDDEFAAFFMLVNDTVVRIQEEAKLNDTAHLGLRSQVVEEVLKAVDSNERIRLVATYIAVLDCFREIAKAVSKEREKENTNESD